MSTDALEHDLPDLAAESLGGAVLYANDDFFAEKENLLKPLPAEWREHAYTDRGKWMDGWESRRKRVPGHDFAVIRLGAGGVISRAVVDTSFFRGNFPAEAAIDGLAARADLPLDKLLDESTAWVELLPRSTLQGHHQNTFELALPLAVTHVRLRIYPDGGVARLRLFGTPSPDWRALGGARSVFDLAALENGGRALLCSDMFFGKKNNLLQPGRALNMSSGWETRRRRGPGHDWVTVRLVGEGVIDRLELDTNHFKGNFPDTAEVEGCVATSDDLEHAAWAVVVPRQKLMAHTRHLFVEELAARGPFTHLRLSVYPDGGVSRMRVWGRLSERGIDDQVAAFLDSRSDGAARAALLRCCASVDWADRVLAARPFGSGARLNQAVDAAWDARSETDLDQAMAGHPRLGERPAPTAQEKWASEEQHGTALANEATLTALRDANLAYEAKFGHVFLLCATGKSADEMLAAARARLENTADTERKNAAEQQLLITHLRLRKLVGA